MCLCDKAGDRMGLAHFPGGRPEPLNALKEPPRGHAEPIVAHRVGRAEQWNFDPEVLLS